MDDDTHTAKSMYSKANSDDENDDDAPLIASVTNDDDDRPRGLFRSKSFAGLPSRGLTKGRSFILSKSAIEKRSKAKKERQELVRQTMDHFLSAFETNTGPSTTYSQKSSSSGSLLFQKRQLQQANHEELFSDEEPSDEEYIMNIEENIIEGGQNGLGTSSVKQHDDVVLHQKDAFCEAFVEFIPSMNQSVTKIDLVEGKRVGEEKQPPKEKKQRTKQRKKSTRTRSPKMENSKKSTTERTDERPLGRAADVRRRPYRTRSLGSSPLESMRQTANRDSRSIVTNESLKSQKSKRIQRVNKNSLNMNTHTNSFTRRD